MANRVGKNEKAVYKKMNIAQAMLFEKTVYQTYQYG